MKIIVDAMGGDFAPEAPLKGAAKAVQELGVSIVAVGDEEQINQTVRQHNIPMENITVRHASDVIDMDEEATDILRKKPDSSLAIAMNALADGDGDALVSAGATGALLVGGTLIVKRIRGIRRPAIATVLPSVSTPWMLIDSGANVECRPDMLVQFAAMGSAYMSRVMGVESPRVALVNNGTEPTKGTALQLEAYPLLQQSGLNFIGNIETRDTTAGVADVVVCDGFTGNVMLKQIEGTAHMVSSMLEEVFFSNLKTKLAALMVKNNLKEFAGKLDYKEYGGAPLLGIQKPVIKAHGSSDEVAIKNAIRQAKICVENDVAQSVESWLLQQKNKAEQKTDE